MDHGPLAEELPDVSEEETRLLTFPNGKGNIPPGTYALQELFCTDPDCDCRRVMFNVIDLQQREIAAVIAYGWADREYYVEWLGYDDPVLIDELHGLTLNTASPQSDFAPDLLDVVDTVLEDDEYVDRLKRHYRMYKNAIADDFRGAE